MSEKVVISCGNSNPSAATRTHRHVALANLFFQFLVTFVTVNIGAIAYVLPYSSSSNWSSVSEMPSPTPTPPSTEQWSSMLVATIVLRHAVGLEQLQQKCRLLSLSWIKISAVIGDPNLKETLMTKWYLIQQQRLLNRIFNNVIQ